MRSKNIPKKKPSSAFIFSHVVDTFLKENSLSNSKDNCTITAQPTHTHKKNFNTNKENDSLEKQLPKTKRKELSSIPEMPPAKRLSKGEKIGSSNSDDETKILAPSHNTRSKILVPSRNTRSKSKNWSKDEDFLLIIIAKFSNLGWQEISGRLPNRSVESCQERLKKIKNMKISWSKGTWTSEKDMAVRILKSECKAYMDWETISRLLGESEDDLKERYDRLMKK